jgi:hypothetical protein
MPSAGPNRSRKDILNGTYWLLAYTNDVNIVGGTIDTIQKNTKALVRRLAWK